MSSSSRTTPSSIYLATLRAPTQRRNARCNEPYVLNPEGVVGFVAEIDRRSESLDYRRGVEHGISCTPCASTTTRQRHASVASTSQQCWQSTRPHRPPTGVPKTSSMQPASESLVALESLPVDGGTRMGHCRPRCTSWFLLQ